MRGLEQRLPLGNAFCVLVFIITITTPSTTPATGTSIFNPRNARRANLNWLLQKEPRNWGSLWSDQPWE